MFSLHERTKIRLCRTAFVLTCLAPTALVLAWAISIRLPGYVRGHEQAIAAHLGLRVRLGAVHIPSPGVVLYESLELSDPETGQLVARLPFAEIQSHSGMVDIQLPYPALVNGHRIDLVWRLVQDHSRGNDDWPALTFRAENVTLGLPGGDQTLTGLAGRVDTTETDWRMAVDFRRAVAGKTQDAKTSFSLRRHRARQGITSNLQLVTGGTPLPCALAESIWPEVTHLGKAADFQGRIVATQAWGHWTTQVVGQVGHIDLDRLIGQQFPHGMSGTAVARFEELTIERGRIEQATGRVRAVDGAVSRALVQAAATHLHLQASAETLRLERPLAYKQIDVSFTLGVQGLLLQGEAGGMPGAMLVDAAGRAVLGEPALPSQPAVNLARALVPQSEWQVPAAREVSGLVQALPVPSLSPPDARSRPAVQARVVGPKLR